MGRFSAGSGDQLPPAGRSTARPSDPLGSLSVGDAAGGGRWGEDTTPSKPRRTSVGLWVLAILPLALMVAAAIRSAPEQSPDDQYMAKVQEGQRRSHDGDLAGAMESYEEARTLMEDRGPAEVAIGTVLLEQQR